MLRTGSLKLIAHIKIDLAFFLDAEVMGWLADRDNGLRNINRYNSFNHCDRVLKEMRVKKGF